MDTSSQQLIEDEKCHENSPPTGENATECARLHLYLARNVVREAMLYAAPTPRFWSPEMHESFTSAFHALVSTEKEEDVASKLEEAAGLYCLAPGGETPKDKQEEPGKKKLDGFIDLRFEGYPNETWNDVLDEPKIRVKLVNAKDPRKAASYHTDLCVQLDNLKLAPIKIPAGFTSALSEPVATLLPRAVKIKPGKARAWELEDPDADCELKLKEEVAPVPENKDVLVNENPSTVVALPFTLFAFLFLGAIMGTFCKYELQECHLNRLWEAVRASFTNVKRIMQVVLFILVVLSLWFTLERLEYTKEVRQFFSDVPVQAWLIPLALLLGFVLEIVVEKVGHGQVKNKQPEQLSFPFWG